MGMQFVMWFSGLRGAIAYAVSLHLDVEDQDQRRALITTALCVVLFTILVLGGSTYPLVKWMNVSRSNFTLSKTEEFGSAIDSECPTNEYNSDEEEGEGHIMRPDETKRTFQATHRVRLDRCSLSLSVLH